MFHLDYIKSSHKDTKLLKTFEQWIEFMYGDLNIGKVKLVRGKVHEYSPLL